MTDNERALLGAVLGFVALALFATVASLICIILYAYGWWGVLVVSAVMISLFGGAYVSVKTRWLG